jgi:hypothetical protein
MRGGARTGAGRPRTAVTAHVRDGTWRTTRHGPLPANVATMPAVTPGGWAPTPADLAGMGGAGRQLVERLVASYTFSPMEGAVLLEAGRAAASLSAVRGVDRSGRTLRDVAALERMEMQWQRQLAGLLAQLKVTT